MKKYGHKKVGQGWFGESHPHGLCAKGIKLGRQHNISMGKNINYALPSEFYLSGHNYSWDYEKGKHKFTLGNMTDAGWFWDGNNDELMGFFTRIQSSTFRNNFLNDVSKKGIKFSDVKKHIVKSIDDGDGLYMMSGDNSNWKFGEGQEFDEQYEVEEAGLDDEQAKEFLKYYFDNAKYPEASYERFKRDNLSSYKTEAKKVVSKSKSFNEFFDNIDKLNEDIHMNTIEWQNDKHSEELNALLGKWKKQKGM